MNPNYRAGFVGIVGLPNAGKSTFLNTLLKEKVSIVSGKPQATRRRVHGIVSGDNYQVVFVDGPGFLQKGKNPMTVYIANEARQVIEDVDAILLLIPCNVKPGEEFMELLNLVKASRKPWAVCVTKVDEKPVDQLLPFLKEFQDNSIEVFNFTSKKVDRVHLQELVSKMAAHLPKTSSPLYDTELYTTENLRDMVAEWIREACFEHLAQEIPFGMAVRVEKFEELKKITKIEASLLVEKDNHKAIVIGQGGSMLKTIGTHSRKKIERLLGQKVYLGLHVTHKNNWTHESVFMKEFGYDHKS